MQTTYNKFPEVVVQGYDTQAWQGWDSIASVLNTRVSGLTKRVLVVDCYPGVRSDELEQRLLATLNAALVVNIESARLGKEALHDLLARNLTDDRVFGVLSCHQLVEFFDPDKLNQMRQRIASVAEGLVVVYGPGAALAHPGDILVYADLPRWEIQQRMRHHGLSNWGRKIRTRIFSVATNALFSLNGVSLTDTKRHCSSAPTFCLIPPLKTRLPWSAAMRYALACSRPPPSRFALFLSLTPASGAVSG